MKPKQNTHVFKIGTRVPDGDINLAYFDVPSLNPKNNVIIGDFSSSITHRLADSSKNRIVNYDSNISRQIKVFLPTAETIFDPWHVRVRNGFFRLWYTVTGKEKESSYFQNTGSYFAGQDKDVILLYSVYDLFVKQYFVYGNNNVNNMWIRNVVDEVPEITSSTSIRLRFVPLYFWNESFILNNRGDLKIVINGHQLDDTKIQHIDRDTGDIILKTHLSFNDIIKVSYWYETDSFDYKGFVMDFQGSNKVDTDINPLAGHAGNNGFGKTSYIYIKPYAMIASTTTSPLTSLFPEGTMDSYHLINLPATIYHPALNDYITTDVNLKQVFMTFKPEIFREPRVMVDSSNLYGGYFMDGRPAAIFGEGVYGGTEEVNPFYDPTAALLASVTVSVDLSPENIKLIDTRSRGGGLKEDINLEDVRKIQPEIEYYWDISSWDGKSFMENGVFVLEIPKILLKENGGDYTEEQVQGIVRERSALGVLPIVRYI